VFAEILGRNARPANLGPLVMQHLDLMIEYYGVHAAIPMFRKHLAWYSAGIPNSSDFRIRVNQITDEKTLKNEILQFWGCVAQI
jgi:tRNA-dihydrouridine synthase B